MEAAPGSEDLIVCSSVGDYRAKNVVVATGTYQRPRMSPFSERLTGDVEQMHSSQYRNPERLPPGVVLVVGSGQSGCQIAEELHENGREVYLATGRSGRAPRRYRGADAVWCMARTGFFDRTVDQLPSPADRFGSSLHVSGKDGGRTLNLHRFCRDGIRLLGHLRDGRGTKLAIAPDLQENLATADKVARVGSAGGDRRRRGSRGSAYRRAPSEPLIYSNTVADPPRAHALFRQSMATHRSSKTLWG